MRIAKRTFPSLPALAAAIEIDEMRVRYWQAHYQCCAHIIKTLVAPPSE